MQFVAESAGHAIKLSNTKYCSAAIMLGESAEIVTSYEISKAQD